MISSKKIKIFIIATGLLIAGGLFISLNCPLSKYYNKKRQITQTNNLGFVRMYLPNEYGNKQMMPLSINNTIVNTEIVASDSQKIKGLSARNSLPEDRGMFFVYDKPAIRYFWMKAMRFAIDIIWIDENFKIIHIADNVRPDSFPKTFSSPKPAQYVLEVNAGFAKKNNIKKDDNITLHHTGYGTNPDWLPGLDLNQDERIQSPLSYH